ncbi:uncharacterized protein C7orf78 homolog [Pelodytes ibericus]
MCTNNKTHPENEHCYLFTNQVLFTANEHLAIERSKNFARPRITAKPDIWRKQPPDFSVRLYRSLTLPRKLVEHDEVGRRQASKPQAPNHVSKLHILEDDHLPSIGGKEEPPKFLTKFKHVGQFEASLMCVKKGQYPKDTYKDPKPHDFRQYEVDIPDFVTSYYRDPSNLKLKSQNVSCVYGLHPLPEKRSKQSTKMFISHKPADLEWDSTLILPKTPWPPKSASFTRHRRCRGVYSAFMDRVDEKFTHELEFYIGKYVHGGL